MEQHGREIDQLCVDLFSLLKYSAARREDFKAKQIEMDLEVVNFIQHTEVRWLSIGPVVQRVLEQWDAICAFVSDLAKDPKCQRVSTTKGCTVCWEPRRKQSQEFQ